MESAALGALTQGAATKLQAGTAGIGLRRDTTKLRIVVGVDNALSVERELQRPYIRKPVRVIVEARAPRTASGRPIDPNTLEPIEGTPDLGHKTGNEFRRLKAEAEKRGMSQNAFNDLMNDADLYQLEDLRSNRSHRFELPH